MKSIDFRKKFEYIYAALIIVLESVIRRKEWLIK